MFGIASYYFINTYDTTKQQFILIIIICDIYYHIKLQKRTGKLFEKYLFNAIGGRFIVLWFIP